MTSQMGQPNFTTNAWYNSGSTVPLGASRGMATDETRMYIADERNNRIVIIPLFN